LSRDTSDLAQARLAVTETLQGSPELIRMTEQPQPQSVALPPLAASPFSVLIAALGGEGGSVLMNWVVAAARDAGFAVQATSVPGVAQRTGSTSYYIEMMPQVAGQPPPVFALVPMPGRVDVVLASELVEAGRMLERGYVAPGRTTLIASTNRVITTAEKVHGADGRHDPAKVEAAMAQMAKRLVSLDLDAIARAEGTLISAALYGALVETGALPFPMERASAVVTDAWSQRGFEAARLAVRQAGMHDPRTPQQSADTVAPTAQEPPKHDAPDALAEVIALGRARVQDFQDEAYAHLFEARVDRLRKAMPANQPVARQAVTEAARRLALWMAYEDIPRVADLKSRPERIARIRREAEASPGQLIEVIDYLKPGAEEVAAMLPPALGQRIVARLARGKSLPLLGRGIHLKATSVTGHLTFRALAGMKRWRRKSMRYGEEQAAIEAWLAVMETALARDAGFAGVVAELPRVLKGYAETHTRGRANYKTLFEGLVLPALKERVEAATTVPLRKALTTALAEPEGKSH
jgi:indolepyruvate ferredoxin oxidoreductase, beta subunit